MENTRTEQKLCCLYFYIFECTYCECIFDGMLNEHKQILKNSKILITHPLFVQKHFLSLFDTMLNFVENLLENERDSRSGPMNDQDHSLSLLDPDRSLVLSNFLTNFLQNLASCRTVFRVGNPLITFIISPKSDLDSKLDPIF
jgi:hypothetical protein